MSNKELIIEQARFCKAMLNRIVDDVERANIGIIYLEGHTKIQNDIIHLRRELMRLSEMIGGMRR